MTKNLYRGAAVILVIVGIAGTIFLQSHTFNPVTVSGSSSQTEAPAVSESNNLETELVEKVKRNLRGDQVSGLEEKEGVIFCLSGKNICGLYDPKTERITVTSGNIKGKTALKRISQIYGRRQQK